MAALSSLWYCFLPKMFHVTVWCHANSSSSESQGRGSIKKLDIYLRKMKTLSNERLRMSNCLEMGGRYLWCLSNSHQHLTYFFMSNFIKSLYPMVLKVNELLRSCVWPPFPYWSLLGSPPLLKPVSFIRINEPLGTINLTPLDMIPYRITPPEF